MTQSPTLTGARVLGGDNPFDVDPATEAFAVPPAGLDAWQFKADGCGRRRRAVGPGVDQGHERSFAPSWPDRRLRRCAARTYNETVRFKSSIRCAPRWRARVSK
ncbi:hypothetical protein TUM20985_39110 [Mycobacterium antarcticum]|nr:hypothetical protein TUM20985_39110 [Mycolicibacterium sp. TUM20985]GLP83065.1 hypothetical protein TUM20984_44850 [Mycolicibacterium sp. TUM20984]